jgi:hypothetical protein
MSHMLVYRYLNSLSTLIEVALLTIGFSYLMVLRSILLRILDL